MINLMKGALFAVVRVFSLGRVAWWGLFAGFFSVVLLLTRSRCFRLSKESTLVL